jgi:uncharacterized protein
MTKVEIVACLAALKADLEAYGVDSLRLFGSHARDMATDASDIDLVVAFHGPATFDAFMGVKQLLEDKLGRRVDLVTDKAIRPELRGAIEREALRVA